MDAIRNVLRGSLARSLHALSDQDRLELAWVVVSGPSLAARSHVIGYADRIVTVEVGEYPWLEVVRNSDKDLIRELTRVAGLPVAELNLIAKR